MANRRNPQKATRVRVGIKGPVRQRPEPLPNDDDLRAVLMLWALSWPMPPAWQAAVNFRLLDVFQRKGRRKITPMQQALSDVAVLTSGMLGEEWSHTHACREVARVRGVNPASLDREWRLRRNEPA